MESITLNSNFVLSTVKSLKRCKFTRVCIRRTDDGVDEIRAFDLNSAMTKDGNPLLIVREKSQSSGEEPCHFWVNVDDMFKAIQFSAGKSKVLVFNYDAKENSVQLVGDRRSTIKSDKSVDEFAIEYSLHGETREYNVDFVNELPHVIHSIGKDNARPCFTGVHFDGTYLVSTDGNRLSVSNVCCDNQTTGNEEPTSIIIPQDVAKIIIEFGSVRAEKECLVNSPKQGECLYTREGLSLYFESISDTYPDFEKVIPNSCNFTFNARIEPMIEAIAPAVKGMITPHGRIDGGDGVLKFKIWESGARKGRAKSETEVEFEVNVEGNVSGMLIGMNMKFFLEALRSQFFAVKVDVIDMDSPVIIRGSNGTQIMMPIQI